MAGAIVPLFPFFADRAEDGAFRVVLEESVSTEEGTGIVHTAPAFGEIDFYVCKRENIDLVCPVDNNGYFTDEVPPYAGMLVKDADKEIIRDLKKQGLRFPSGNDPPPLSVLLALRYSADLQSGTNLVCGCRKNQGSACSRPMSRSIGFPSILKKAGLAIGWKMPATGRSAATVIGERRSRSGELKMGDCNVIGIDSGAWKN